MKLESARELKASLSLRVLERVIASEIAALGVPARRTSLVESILPTLALGLTPVRPNDYRLAVRIQRRAVESSSHLEAIEKEANGEVDVRYVGRVVKRARWFRSRHRPLHIGVSIGHHAVTAGTLGCFVRTRRGEIRILSNNHVLADENNGQRGDDILQPGRLDGGARRRDTIGALDSFVRLRARAPNIVDCATSTVKEESVGFEPVELRGAGVLSGVQPPTEDVDLVEKLGRTTGHTRGRITAFELDNVVVAYDIGNLRFDDQVEIAGADTGPFSDGGDSGSLIFTSGDRLGFALLFAGSQQGGSNGAGLTYANPLAAVLRELRVELLT